MRFICTEFDSNINNLYKKSEIDQSVISESGSILTKSFRMKTSDGVIYGYLSDTAREIIYSQFLNDETLYTPSGWIAAKTIGTDYTGISQDFIFQNSSIADILSSYFYTIISDNGVYFSLPQRNSYSKEIKTYTVIDELENYETDYSFQNESGKTFTLSESIKDTVIPLLIDSTLKSNRINKYKSKQNTRTIQTGSDANPLDYIQINGTYYILISKSEIKNNYYQYICVKEEKESNSISGSNICPFIPGIIIESTSEYFTGEYYHDGRPKYAKWINFGAQPNNTTKAVAHGITFSSSTRFLEINGEIINPVSWVNRGIPLPNSDANTANLTWDNINFYITNAHSWAAAYTECWIKVKYVK
jgi:hypothetical protein